MFIHERFEIFDNKPNAKYCYETLRDLAGKEFRLVLTGNDFTDSTKRSVHLNQLANDLTHDYCMNINKPDLTEEEVIEYIQRANDIANPAES